MKLTATHLKDNQFEGMMTTNDLEITGSENGVELFITTKSGEERPLFGLCIAKQVGKYFENNGAETIEKIRDRFYKSDANIKAGKADHSFNLNFGRILRVILFDAFEESLADGIPLVRCEVKTNGKITIADDPIDEDPMSRYMDLDLSKEYKDDMPQTAKSPVLPVQTKPVAEAAKKKQEEVIEPRIVEKETDYNNITRGKVTSKGKKWQGSGDAPARTVDRSKPARNWNAAEQMGI